MNFRFPKMRGISWLAAEPVSFSRRTLLHGVSNTSYMMMRLMMMMVVMVMIPEKYCRVKYKKCCTLLYLFTLKNLQVIQEEGVWHCTLLTKMSFWISDWACYLIWIWQACCGCTTGFNNISCFILACLPRTEWRQTGARCVRILDIGPTV